MKVVNENGKEYLDFGKGMKILVTGYRNIIDQKTDEIICSVPEISESDDADYRWQLSCLESRLEHPELYEANENVPQTIKRLQQWLENYKKKEKSKCRVG